MRFLVDGVRSVVSLLLYLVLCSWAALFCIGVLSACITTGRPPRILPCSLPECFLFAFRENTIATLAFLGLHLLGGRLDLSGIQRTVRIVTAILLAFGIAYIVSRLGGREYAVGLSWLAYAVIGIAFLHQEPAASSADRTVDVLAGPTGMTLSRLRALLNHDRSQK